MGRYQNSDYAVNTFSRGIVYRFADRTVEITLGDYLTENPGSTEHDFEELKALSDALYHRQDLDTYNQCRLNVPIHNLDQYVDETAPTIEELSLDKLDGEDRVRVYYLLRASGRLTETQCRRFELHIVQGVSLREIAKRENVHFTSVDESVTSVLKKIMRFFEVHTPTPPL